MTKDFQVGYSKDERVCILLVCELEEEAAREAKVNINTWSKLKKHMDKRFLTSSYKKEIYLRITFLSQKNLKMEAYIREFEQLQLRVELDEDEELTIVRFIANKVELQPYLSFDNVFNLTIRI